MTGLQLAMLSGALLLAGVASLIGWAMPANVHLKDAIGRLQPLPTIAPPTAGGRRDTETTIGAGPSGTSPLPCGEPALPRTSRCWAAPPPPCTGPRSSAQPSA